jgi:pantoate--beta-alanine ligase
MQIIETKKELKEALKALRKGHKTVGFIPTMGFLHEGHLSLVKRAKAENDVVVVSIFVNPTQFGPNEDFSSYPRNIAKDCALVELEGCDLVFTPEPSEMYPEPYMTYVDVTGGLTDKLCGSSRPGHFQGVATVVTKLFNLVKPTRAYFGQKDAQQVAVIEQMVSDLDMELEIVPCPIVREADGLALSSRNTYLSPTDRQEALVLSQSLIWAKSAIEAGEKNAAVLLEGIKVIINVAESAEIDYVQIVDAKTLETVETLKGTILIALAVKIGKPRLIDNMRIEVK